MSKEGKTGILSKTPSTSLPFQRRKQLERDLEHITEEMYRRNKELADTNKTLSLLQTIETLALESRTSLEDVCEHITDAITQITDYMFVGLLTQSSRRTEHELKLSGWSGIDWLGKDKSLGFSRPLHMKLTHEWFKQFERAKLISLEGMTVEQIANFIGCTSGDIKRMEGQLPLKSIYVEKLIARRRIVGLLVVGFRSADAKLSQTDDVFLSRLSESIGLALDNKLLFEENKSVLRQLQESNNKLRALDEAKDDFISMASHQLRTPLTSVKGYISMLLEGDAGKINPVERKMLQQAFFSSQRMVYLIADLLNVSRIRTGKFLIDSSPVQLSRVITEEIDQLKEMSKAHSITLTFKPPKEFPELLLDETKTRQVIMNFIDNAIYYTPANGHIDVQLLDKGATVELRIQDDGMGVPRSEQPHLFTKFYRAANARKARPDGTGLGLFMAKKVITAQGGAIIFESKEGKGSTFGFLFKKANLKTEQKSSTPVTAEKA